MGLLRNPVSQAVVSITPHYLLLSLAVEAFLIDQIRKGNWLLWGKVARLRAKVQLWQRQRSRVVTMETGPKCHWGIFWQGKMMVLSPEMLVQIKAIPTMI